MRDQAELAAFPNVSYRKAFSPRYRITGRLCPDCDLLAVASLDGPAADVS